MNNQGKYHITKITTEQNNILPILVDLNPENFDVKTYPKGLYTLIAIHESIVNNTREFEKLKMMLNSIYKREGFEIFIVKDEFGKQVCYDYPNKLVLCVVIGHWG